MNNMSENENKTRALTLRERLDDPKIKNRFNEVLGKRSAGFMTSIISVVNASKNSAQLKRCAPDSIISAAMVAATLDLPINPSLGFAYIVPYGDEAQFQMGWKGYNQLGLRTGQYSRMNAAPVYEGQLKKYDPITGDFIYDLAARSSDKIVGYVSYFRLTNGYESYLYMTMAEILAHAKRYSAAFKKGFGPWVDTQEAMCLKTVHKLNISKWGPMTQDMELALVLDQGSIKEVGSPIQYPDNDDNGDEPEDTGKSKTEKLADKLNAGQDITIPALRAECRNLVEQCVEAGVFDQEAADRKWLPMIGDDLATLDGLNTVKNNLTAYRDEGKKQKKGK
jgi:recombination protein RecT